MAKSWAPRASSRPSSRWGKAEAATNYQQAVGLAWDIIQLLERPGAELPELAAIREACRAASQLNAVCNLLRESGGDILDLDELPDGAFIPPPE